MRFPTMWYVRPAKAQISLGIRESDQNLCLSLKYSMNNMLLTEPHLEFLSLKGGRTGSPESTHVKIPHCWTSHFMAQICLVADAVYFSSLYRSSHSLDMKTGSELLISLLMVSLYRSSHSLDMKTGSELLISLLMVSLYRSSHSLDMKTGSELLISLLMVSLYRSSHSLDMKTGSELLISLLMVSNETLARKA